MGARMLHTTYNAATTRRRARGPLALAALGFLTLAACTPDRTPPVVEQPVEQATSATTASVALAVPSYQVGDAWQYSDGYALRVAATDGDTTRFARTDTPGRWMDRTGLFRTAMRSPEALREEVFRSDDPMVFYAAGRNEPVVYIREYLRNGVLVRHRTSWVKEGSERITVPAGTFDTVVFTMRTRSLTGNWTGFERWWYSPEVRNYVRLEFKYGDTPDSARVLTSYSVN